MVIKEKGIDLIKYVVKATINKYMKKVFYAFKEHKEFKKTVPWSAVTSTLTPNNSIVLPHYAETIEINIWNTMPNPNNNITNIIFLFI